MDIELLQPTTHRRYVTAGGIGIDVRRYPAAYGQSLPPLIERVNRRRGAVFSSSFEFPNRYTRWDFGFADPLLEVSVRGNEVRIDALNPRGKVLLPAIARRLRQGVADLQTAGDHIRCRIEPSNAVCSEEERTRRPSVFSLLRSIVELFRGDDPHLGLYGAFGYDLTFQLEAMELQIERPADQRDLVLYLPDEILVVDHLKQAATLIRYEFSVGEQRTDGLARGGEDQPFAAPAQPAKAQDHAPGEYARSVDEARQAFHRGDMFECVLTQTFFTECSAQPATVFDRLRHSNPAPYGALLNLGQGEFLVAASPEMFVRVQGRRVETCPISGTIARGRDALGDAEQIRKLLNSEKDASELTMCTDVDRNDKARVCVPGSVRVIGRRQIEMYSRLIHTVDHVEGTLRGGLDALDAFLTHTWAVTVTGAPKRAAMKFIETHERSSRRWYAGAIGFVGFDGSLNTGLTLRTLRLKDGIAEARVGATLLYDSVPEEEDAECKLKISALMAAVRPPQAAVSPVAAGTATGAGRRVLLVDHEDSFVLTLADYFRQTGAEVVTLRPQPALAALKEMSPDLVVLSPGPGQPSDFPIGETIARATKNGAAVFGVCLGLQGIVEHFGGRLGTLEQPMHGKPSRVVLTDDPLFAGLPPQISVGRYHSLFADRASFPAALRITAESEDGVIMALSHESLPIRAVQFHPESILSADNGHGLTLIGNAIRLLAQAAPRQVSYGT